MTQKDLPFQVDYTDKVVVITGAGGVLCSKMAEAFALCHAKVALLDLHLEAAEAKAQEIINEGGIAKGYAANVLQKDSLEAVHQQILKDFGKCDILINGAGGNSPKATTTDEFYADKLSEDTITFFDLKTEGFQFVFDLNILGTLLPSQVFAVDMIGREGCSILNISSMNAFRPLTKIPAYSAAKAGISNFTAWLSVHFAPCGIRCNAIAPGFFLSNQNRSLLFTDSGEPTARTGKILAATPMKRLGRIDDLIGTLLWLSDDQASGFVTGTVIPVDGGFSAYSGV